MRKVNRDPEETSKSLKIPKVVTTAGTRRQVGDVQPKRVPVDWAMEWSGPALWKTVGGPVRQGDGDL